MKTDLHYINDGYWIRFMPNTKAGEAVYNEIARKDKDGVAVIPVSWKASVFKQIKDAGYTIRKAPKQKPVTAKEIDAILNQLNN